MFYKFYKHITLAFYRGVCGCAHTQEDGELRAVQYEYWELLDQWINVDGAYDPYDDFTVVLQTYMRDQGAPYDVNR